RYGVGHVLLRIAATSEPDALIRRARPVLERLAAATGETVGLALARRGGLVYVDQVEPPQVLAPNWLRRHVPPHPAASGKAFRAWLPAAGRAALLPPRLERYTGATLTDRAALDAELESVRRAGFAVSRGELEDELDGASAPVLGPQARPLAVVSVWGP